MKKAVGKAKARVDLLCALSELRSAITTKIGPTRDEPLHGVNGYYVQGSRGVGLLETAVGRVEKCFPELVAETGLGALGDAVLLVVGGLASVPSESTIDDIERALSEKPLRSWTIHRELHGARLHKQASMSLGPFTFWSWPQEWERLRLADRFTTIEEVKAALVIDDRPRVLVAYSCPPVREYNLAKDLAHAKYEQLEETLRYMLGPQKPYEIGITDFRDPRMREVFGICSTNLRSGLQHEGAMPSKFPLDHPLFVDPSRGHDRVWALFEKAGPTDMQKRIWTAVAWVGRGVHDQSTTKGFVQFMFAYEALLNYEASGERFSPSLVHGMAEIGAFVLGSDLETRKGFFKLLKDLYRTRCAIAHGGSGTATQAEYHQAFQVVRDLVSQLLVDPTLSVIHDINGLREWTTNMRFSSALQPSS